MTAPQPIKLASIRIDGGTQARVKVPESRVVEYVEALVNGDVFPPAIVYHDGINYWMADGFTRYFAHKRAERSELLCEVRQGTQRDALKYALGANATHGEPRTNEDKRNAVKMALADAEWSKLGDAEIATICRVSRGMVYEQRRLLQGIASPSRTHLQPKEETQAPPAPAEDDEQAGEDSEPEPKEKQSRSYQGDPQRSRPVATEVVDCVGIVCRTPELRKAFAARGRASVARRNLQDALSIINEICGEPGGEHLAFEVGSKLKGNSVRYECHHVKSALSRLKNNLPYVSVCPYCHDKGRKTPDRACKACKGHGYLTEMQWGQVPQDLKDKVLADFKADDSRAEEDLEP